MNRTTVAAAALLSLAALVGCGPETREYRLIVRNDSPDPMTVLLTKDGPPMENHWLPPEDLAAMRKRPADWKIFRGVIPPGKTADFREAGRFDAGTSAMLRVYRGDNTFDALLGYGPTSPNRTDLPIAPGENTVVIDKTGKPERQ